MASHLRHVWEHTGDGWRYRQVLSTSFILGARLDDRAARGYSGGEAHPAGTWLVQGPADPYATAVRDADFPAWRAGHP